MKYSYTKQVPLSFQEAKEKTTAALAQEGFGILTEIDVKAALKKKLGVEYGEYVILGACNPPFAYQALQAEKEIGLFMPCNVIIYEDGGKTFISAILPTVTIGAINNPSLVDIAKTVEEKLKKVINNI